MTTLNDFFMTETREYHPLVIVIILILLSSLTIGTFTQHWTVLHGKTTSNNKKVTQNLHASVQVIGDITLGAFGDICMTAHTKDQVETILPEHYKYLSGGARVCVDAMDDKEYPYDIKKQRKSIHALLIISIMMIICSLPIAFLRHGTFISLFLLILGGIFSLTACMLWITNKTLYKKPLDKDITQLHFKKKLGWSWYITLISSIISVIGGIILLFYIYEHHKHEVKR